MSVIGRCKGFFTPNIIANLGDLKKLSISWINDKNSEKRRFSNDKVTDFMWLWLDGLRLFIGLVTQLKKWTYRLDGSWARFTENKIIVVERTSDWGIKFLGNRFFGVIAKECLFTFNSFLEWPQWLRLNEYMRFI